MSLVGCCFEGLFAHGQAVEKRANPLRELGHAGSWETLPSPVAPKALAGWLPCLICGPKAGHPHQQVLFLHLSDFNLQSLDASGCTRRDLLRHCDAELRSLHCQAQHGLAGLHVVADLKEVTLAQLNSHWWKSFVPKLLELVEERFPGLLKEIIFVRAGKVAALSAQRLVAPYGSAGVVVDGDELVAESMLRSRGLDCAVEGLHRDPHIPSVCSGRPRQTGLCSTCLRLAPWVAIACAAVSLAAGFWRGLTNAEPSSSDPVSPAPAPFLDMMSFLPSPDAAVASASLPAAALAACVLRGRVRDKEPVSDALLQLLLLLAASPLAWAVSSISSLPLVLAVASPALALAAAGMLLLKHQATSGLAKATNRRLRVSSPQANGTAGLGTSEGQPPRNGWWPEMFLGQHGEPRFQTEASIDRIPGRRSTALEPGPTFEGNALELRQRLQDICNACRKVQRGAGGQVGDLNIQCVVQQETRSVWFANEPSNPVTFVASEVLIDTPEPVEAALWSIYDGEERMKWDGSFVSFKVLGEREAQASSAALGDFLYCRVGGLPGVTDRDMVQERFLLCLPEPDEGYAIVIHSCSASQEGALRKERLPNVVRANTILSGYLLRPNPSGRGVLLTGLSQTDLGGSVPQWAQTLVKKAGKKKPLEWAQKLEDHCNKRAGLNVASRRKLSLAAFRGWSREFVHATNVDGRCIPLRDRAAGPGGSRPLRWPSFGAGAGQG